MMSDKELYMGNCEACERISHEDDLGQCKSCNRYFHDECAGWEFIESRQLCEECYDDEMETRGWLKDRNSI